jgi:uncharacterized membrane protein
MDPHMIIALFHIVLIVPLFLFVAFQRAATPEWVYGLLFGLGAIVFCYHAYKSFIKWQAKSPSIWVNMIHVFYVAPLLVWVGYQGKKAPRAAYELMALVGFGALGYHMYNLIQIAQTFNDAA